MELAHWLNFLLLPTFIFILAAKFLRRRKLGTSKLSRPPSPPSRPIIGHLHLLKPPLHRTLQELSAKYGDIFSLRFGTRKVLVISSPALVEECFTKHDVVFANRPVLIAGKHLNYNNTTVGFSSYGDHWRNLRRLTTIELFSTSRMNSFSGIRTDEVRLLLKKLFLVQSGAGKVKVKVNLTEKVSEVAFNVVMRIIAGKRYYGGDEDGGVDEGAKEFQDIIKEMEALRGSSNLNDHIPILRWVDYGGVEKKMMKLGEKMDGFLQELVDEQQRLRSREGSESKKDNLINVLLSLRESDPEFYTDQTIKGIITTTVTAGTQTSAATLEWAMSLLLNKPQKLEKAFMEIESVVGLDRLFEESDIPKLSYLHNIINESHRLFPPAPLLLPHESSADCKVGGFEVARGTMLLVNVWSMNRDPKFWSEAEEFVPERFEGEGEGEGFKLVPFGAGRRACPGAGLAKRIVALTLGALIQSFEWERAGEEEIDMREGTGLTMPKALPLEAVCRPREAMVKVLSSI